MVVGGAGSAIGKRHLGEQQPVGMEDEGILLGDGRKTGDLAVPQKNVRLLQTPAGQGPEKLSSLRRFEPPAARISSTPSAAMTGPDNSRSKPAHPNHFTHAMVMRCTMMLLPSCSEYILFPSTPGQQDRQAKSLQQAAEAGKRRMAFPRGEVYAAFCTAGSTRPCQGGTMRIFTQEIIVAPQHIDIQNRVSNLCYVQWMQDLAINHSTVQGWGVERYEAEGHGWVVRQHTITYKRPALAGDVITAATWVAELASRQSLRRYLFWRAADRSVLAEAATVWVYIDMATGRPSRLPASLQSAFEVVADDKEVLQLLQG